MLNPGLVPWAMQEYRPYRALLRPHQLLAYSDALVLAVSLINYLLVLMRLSLRSLESNAGLFACAGLWTMYDGYFNRYMFADAFLYDIFCDSECRRHDTPA